MNYMQSDYIQSMTKKIDIKSWINNPYTAGIVGILVIVYGHIMLSKLPHYWSWLLTNPLVKILIVLVIILIHKFHPMASLITGLVMIILIFTMSHIHTHTLMQTQTHQMKQYKQPAPGEMEQIQQEINSELIENPSGLSGSPYPPHHNKSDGLHPRNRPTDETMYADSKVLDPNDPHHPGWKVITPNADTALYELNPPYANKDQPESVEKLNAPGVLLPEGGPTRYSAYHGYKLA